MLRTFMQTDLSVFVGPTLMRVTQDVATLAVTANSQAVAMSIDRQSATTGKAGNAGVDVSHRMTPQFGVGVFVRYAGGEVDLPAVSKLKVGGIQAGGGLRMRF